MSGIQPVTFEPEMAALIDAIKKSPGYAADAWGLDSLREIRRHIKVHYLGEQNLTCCYCDREYPTKHGLVWAIDHIVPRSTHLAFMFTPENLIVSCPECNNQKADANVFVNRRRKTWTNKSTDYSIVHPHFDVYSDNIVRVGPIYVPITEKGIRLVTLCKLNRFSVREAGLRGPSVIREIQLLAEAIMKNIIEPDGVVELLAKRRG